MPLFILIGTILLVVGILLKRWFVTATPEEKYALFALTVGTFGGIGLLFLIFTGRFFHALGWGLAALGLFMISGLWRRKKNSQQTLDASEPLKKVYGDVIESMTEIEAYKTLGLKKGASKADIQKAYVRLIERASAKTDIKSKEKAAKITQAYDLLMDPQRWT